MQNTSSQFNLYVIMTGFIGLTQEHQSSYIDFYVFEKA